MLGNHPKVLKPQTASALPTPPSIPSPLISFGFTEDKATGRLIARNLKLKKVTPLRSPLGQPLQRATKKTSTRKTLPGPKFMAGKRDGHDLDQFLVMPTGGKGGNLVSKARRPQDGSLVAHLAQLQLEPEKNPGPNSYDIRAGEKWISTNGTTVKSYRMGDVALPRHADLLEKQVIKNGIPGPAVYNVASSTEQFLQRVNEGKVNTASSETPRFAEKAPEVPAPNMYTVAVGSIMTPQKTMDAPFGTSACRFDKAGAQPSEPHLGPGYYKADVVTSMIYEAQKRVATCSPSSRSFGFAGERFPYNNPSKKTPTTPGPGAYNVEKNIRRTATAKSGSSRPQSVLLDQLVRGSTAPAGARSSRLGTAVPKSKLATLVTVPERFENALTGRDAPPPGTYNLGEAHDNVSNHGKLAIRSAFVQQQVHTVPVGEKRETYFDHIQSQSPGPSWYDYKEEQHEYNRFLAEGSPSADKNVGFLGRAPRIPEAIKQATRNSALPAPNNYNIDQHSLEKHVRQVGFSWKCD
jgi:hypothetical protein